MHKDFVPPISIEEFAAYLDGNLSDDEMQRVSSVIENDEAMQDIAVNNLSIEDALSHREPSEFTLPDELTSLDFEIPQFDDSNSMNFDNDWEDLEVAACAADTTCYAPTEYDDSSTLPSHEDTVGIHHEECLGDVSDGINNDITQEHNVLDNDIPEINE